MNKITPYKDKLQNIALKLQNVLKKQKIKIFFNNDSFFDYFVKLIVFFNNKFYGTILIYYKPTKNTYLIKKHFHHYNNAIDKIVDSSWNKINYFDIYSFDSNIYEAFVDGSYIANKTGYGSVIYLGNEIKAKISGTISNIKSRQFGGELKSVIETIKWCENNSVKKIRINYDYSGIEKFITGEWKAKNILSKEYVNFILNTSVKIEWRHIKSHTGNIGNNKADLLAQNAAIIKSK
ncbi:MAG: hypothetical protein LBH27_00525 [Endomicrobium sp.]|jgi:ribonuclease HI|nr:hypothetical protein [Endomicrobium sp.]